MSEEPISVQVARALGWPVFVGAIQYLTWQEEFLRQRSAACQHSAHQGIFAREDYWDANGPKYAILTGVGNNHDRQRAAIFGTAIHRSSPNILRSNLWDDGPSEAPLRPFGPGGIWSDAILAAEAALGPHWVMSRYSDQFHVGLIESVAMDGLHPRPLATDPSGPMAICKAILKLAKEKA